MVALYFFKAEPTDISSMKKNDIIQINDINLLLSYNDNNCDDYMHNIFWIQKVFLTVDACFFPDLILYNLIYAMLRKM